MSWNIVYTAGARQIFEYIAYELLVPETAAGQVQRVMEEIRALDKMPMRFRLYDTEPWHSVGLRFFPVDNFLKQLINVMNVCFPLNPVARYVILEVQKGKP